jgi:hypothetical protein
MLIHVVAAVPMAPAEMSRAIVTVSIPSTPLSLQVMINRYSANDPKIFLSWIGTDKNGNYMLSQTKRISRFTEYSVGNVYQDALKIFT